MALRVTNLTLIWTIEGWQDTSSVWGTEVSLLGSSASSSSNRVELMAALKALKPWRDVNEGFKVQFKRFGGKVTAELKMRRSGAPSSLPPTKRPRFQTPFAHSPYRKQLCSKDQENVTQVAVTV